MWAACTLNDDVLSESTPPNTVFEYVDISNVTEGHISEDVNTYEFSTAPSRARRVVRDGDVVVSTVRTYLRAIAQVPKHMSHRIFSTGFAVLRPGEQTDPRYLAYVVGSRQVIDEIVATSVGVSYPAIQGMALHRIRIPHHCHDAQIRIADYLDRETSGIDWMIKKLDQLDETLRFRRSRTTQESLTGFPKVPLGAHCRVVNGSTPLRSRDAYWTTSGGFPWLNSAAVNDAIVLDAPRQVTSTAMAECHLPRVGRGDVLIGITGQGRTRGMTAQSGIDCTISQHVAAVQVRDGWDSRFLYYALDAEYQNLRRVSESAGSTKGAITCAMLSQYRVPLPSPDEQTRIAGYLDEATSKIDTMLAKVSELKSLLLERRAALITDVVTGKKEVA